MKKIKSIFVIVFSSLIPSFAFAAFPAGQYTMTFYGDYFSGSGTQGICLQGSGASGTWYSDTYPDWSGEWFRKGNDIHLNGNYAGGIGNDAFELTRISNGLFAGYWQEWRDDRSYVSYLTNKFVFQKSACNPPAAAGFSLTAPLGAPSQGRR